MAAGMETETASERTVSPPLALLPVLLIVAAPADQGIDPRRGDNIVGVGATSSPPLCFISATNSATTSGNSIRSEE